MGGGLGEVYAYTTNKVFGAVLGVAWGYCFPLVTSSSQYAWIQALCHDIVGSIILCIVTYYLVQRFDRRLEAVEAGEQGSAPKPTPTKFAATVKFEVHVMIVAGFSLALDSLHATFAEELWDGLSYYITNGESSGGDCVLEYKSAQVAGALLLGLAVCAAFTWLCVLFTERSETASHRPWATVWDLMAASFSYAIGWTFFTALTLSMGCLPGNMEYYVVTQVTRALPLTIVAALVYFKLIPYLDKRQPFYRTDIFIDIMKDVVYTILTLSWLNVYYQPISYFYSTSTFNTSLYSIAVVITAVGASVAYTGYFDLPPPEHPDRPLVSWYELAQNFTEWLTMFSWWYPLDTSFETFYTGSGWLNTGSHPVSSYFFSILAALFVTAFVAALVASLAMVDPKLDRMDVLPDWAVDYIEDKTAAATTSSGESTALLSKDK